MLLKEKLLFSREECNIILNMEKYGQKKWALNDRSYTSFILDRNHLTEWIFEKILLFFETESKYKIEQEPKHIHYHIFKTGDFFSKHNDTRKARLFSIGCLLNEEFSGGNFNLYDENKTTLIKSCGNSYLFDVRIEHEISKITEGERHSLILFLDNENIKLEKNKII